MISSTIIEHLQRSSYEDMIKLYKVITKLSILVLIIMFIIKIERIYLWKKVM